MAIKCKKCGKMPKQNSEHTYRESVYKIYCECGNKVIGTKSMWSTAIEWNKKNKK